MGAAAPSCNIEISSDQIDDDDALLLMQSAVCCYFSTVNR